MGKKIKKEEKGPPDDVFDPVTIESSQAETIVLLLNSQEEDVVAKSCESIYRFCEKADDNKKVMLNLGACEPLIRLIESEDKIVRRNACMAVGVMASDSGVRKELRKNPQTVPALINLLNPEEGTIIHEFATLCLASMAQEYSSKATIFEKGGLEPIIHLLSDEDPDVQKNSVEAMSLLLHDYSCRGALKESNGLPPLVELLKSEYPVIQSLALVALRKASEEAACRVALREMEAVSKLIDFIGKPEFSELHVFAVMVLSNCLAETGTLEAIKENRGIQKLVAFITDKTPPEDEEPKKGGKDKKGGSRAGKKSKGDEDDKHKKGAEPESPAETLPEVKEHAAKAIARCAKNADNRKILHEQEVEKMLIALLNHENAGVHVSAAQAIAMMAQNLTSCDMIGQADGIEPLVRMCRSDIPEVRESGALALSYLTTSNKQNCTEFIKHKGIEPIISMLSDTQGHAAGNAAATLNNMATDITMRTEIIRFGVIKALIDAIKSDNAEIQEKSAFALASFVRDAEHRVSFCEGGGIPAIVNLLHSNYDKVRDRAAWAIKNIAVDEITASQIVNNGGLEILREICRSESRDSCFTTNAMNRLLDHNLSAKYALSGELGLLHKVKEGFFDYGQVRTDHKFYSLQHYCEQKLNLRREILLINPQPEKVVRPPTPQSDHEITEKLSKSSISRGTSRGGRESKLTLSAKSRAQREKEEKQKEEEQQLKEAEPSDTSIFTPPGDPILYGYLEEVRSRIQPLPTTRDQAVALAHFVCDKMGGRIDRGQFHMFSWKLPIAEIKYSLQSNVIPLGMIKTGVHYHRALLFKCLADSIAVYSSLIRAQYNRAWNFLMLADEPEPGKPRYPQKEYLIDLMYQPGHLMLADSPEAARYQTL